MWKKSIEFASISTVGFYSSIERWTIFPHLIMALWVSLPGMVSPLVHGHRAHILTHRLAHCVHITEHPQMRIGYGLKCTQGRNHQPGTPYTVTGFRHAIVLPYEAPAVGGRQPSSRVEFRLRSLGFVTMVTNFSLCPVSCPESPSNCFEGGRASEYEGVGGCFFWGFLSLRLSVSGIVKPLW